MEQMDKYAVSLRELVQLTDEQFQEIPEIPLEIIDLRELQQIKCKEQAWLIALAKSISPDKESSGNSLRPWPKYAPQKSIKKGGESIIFSAINRWTSKKVIIKVPLPKFSLRDTKRLPAHVNPAQQQKIEKGAKGLLQVAASLYKRTKEPASAKKGAIPEFPKEEEEANFLAKGKEFERFRRSYILQQQLNRIGNKMDPNQSFGYIPDVFLFGESPHCFIEMEHIAGQGYLDYLRNHSDNENFDLFLKLVIFIEKVCHNYAVAHCDIAARNVLVREVLDDNDIVIGHIPIVLDFGIAKCERMEEITLDNMQMGSVLYGTETQMSDAKNRGFLDDIFALGRLMWVTFNRREPSLDGIIAVSKGSRVEYDPKTVSELFSEFYLPTDRIKQIFRATQDCAYQDISEFRKDLEGLFLPEAKTVAGCSSPCPELLRLRSLVNGLGEILKG